jgi:response regulator RpfG family c-di-GMP phosphodiesterase
MGTKATIIVVDDENTVRLLLKNELNKAGYDVKLAKNAEEAIDALKKEHFEVALIDKNLSNEDGIDLLRRCRMLDSNMELILMTGYATLESAIEAIKIGIFDYITKPFDHIPTVIHRITRAVERRCQRDEMRELIQTLGQSNKEVAESMYKLQRTYLETAKAMSRILGMRIPGRNDENQRVQSLAVRIGTKVDLSGEDIGWLSLAALLRDMGKVGKIEDIINKPERLKEEDYNEVKLFPEMGADHFASIPGFEPLSQIIRQQQERFDGTGYPDGLSGERISLAARVLAVTDTYVVMTSNRPFRKAMDKATAIKELRAGAGTQFDPRIVGLFIDEISDELHGVGAATRREE